MFAAFRGDGEAGGGAERIPLTRGLHLYDISYQVSHHFLKLLLWLRWWQLLLPPVVT